MRIIKIKQIIGLFALFIVGLSAFVSNPNVLASGNRQPTELPAGCGNLLPPSGSKAVFHAYAVGVQIYKWNGASWDFVAPLANLYADEDFYEPVGIHYAGPTWESNSGSKVVSSRLAGCEPESTAIPWLLLQTTSTEGRGVFRKVTHIQRVNTAGGLRPALPGLTVGEEKRVPYTAEYYFYRAAGF